MPSGLILRRKSNIILFPAILTFLISCQIPAFSLGSREEIPKTLRKPDDTTDKVVYSIKGKAASPVYIIGPDDVLGISVWKDLGTGRKEGDQSKRKDYTINKGDTLEISVWQWPDLLKRVVVRPDGKITFPLVGDIEAEGLTLSQLDDIVTKRLTEFIKSPEVSVMIMQFGLENNSQSGPLSFIKVDDLSSDNIKVRPDGKISFPFIGEIQAEGLTLDELRISIAYKLSDIVSNADVFVQVNEFGGNKVIVLGEVYDPGVYLTGPVSVVEAISLAGGYTKDAILRNVFVIRGDLNNPQVIKVNVSDVVKGRDLSQNVLLQGRDIVYVPRSFISDFNYILNQLIQPLTTSASAVTGIKTIRTRTTPKK
jgi:polysaccharide export outer membrane protein